MQEHEYTGWELEHAYLPPDPARDVHCWFMRGPFGRLGKQGPWKRIHGWLWLIAPKEGSLPL